jgi:hypothetical protein
VSGATYDALVAAAADVLRGNDLGDYTKPSPRLYPHQWNWDSAFIAIGWAHLDWPRAVREIDALLAGQWTNGMLPHIIYDPSVTDYHPGPEWWPETPTRRPEVLTSGISQPPVLPSAVYIVGLLQPGVEARLAWWRRLYEPLRAMLEYFVRHRTLGGSPLIAVIHPWESGLDNSPRWDFAVRVGLKPARPYRRVDDAIIGASMRPTPADYDLYMHLVEQIAAHRYDMSTYLPAAPVAVYDTLFNAIWHRAALDLNRVAEALGEMPPFSADGLAAFARAFHATLWNADVGLFRDYDTRGRAQIPVDTAAGLASIYGGLVDAGRALEMLDRYRRRSSGCLPFPSTLPDQAGFDPARYWRGPVWVNTNWFVVRGLEALGLRQEAQALADDTLALIRSSGLHEYYHALTGKGIGGSHFSWSAALAIDLVRRTVPHPSAARP